MTVRLNAVLRAVSFIAITWTMAQDRSCSGDEAKPAACLEKSSRELSSSGCSVKIHPRRVYCGTLVTASLPNGAPCGEDARIQWTVTGGLLLYDDLPEVHWRAPRDPGRHLLKATVSCRDTVARGELAVEVHAPRLEGMVWIPPGTFLCGDVDGTRNAREVKTAQNDNDEPFHLVYLDGYWIDRYPVTNRKYVEYLEDALRQGMVRVEKVAVMGEFEGSWVPFYYFQPYQRLILHYHGKQSARTPRFLHRISWESSQFQVCKEHEDHPVVDVTWFGAAAYANFYGKQLPTEAQWEKAARETDGRRHPWGDNLPTSYHVNLSLELTPVGSYSPLGDSPFGVADMLSPSFEWTNDWFNRDYYRDYLDDPGETPHRNPQGTFWGRSHTLRGFPNALRMRTPSVDQRQPLTRRYNWQFEFLLGDSFGNRETTFRAVVRSKRACSNEDNAKR